MGAAVTSPTPGIPAGGRPELVLSTEQPSGLEVPRSSGTDYSSIRRQSTASAPVRIPSLNSPTTLAQRTQGQFTLAGPDNTTQVRLTHEPFVHPAYADLNPAYDQPANTKPVWSLAKPLPRVVRPGMVPTRDELLQARANAQLPAENSQNLGLEVNPNDIEAGRIEKSANLRKVAAQVQDARLQRENSFINKILNSDATSPISPIRRLSRTSSAGIRRPLTIEPAAGGLSTVQENQNSVDTNPGATEEPKDEHLQPLPEEPEDHPDEHEPKDQEEVEVFPTLDHAALPEDLHPLVQDLVEEEVHNNHTTWSVFRTHHREPLAEALGAFIQLVIGFSADLSVTLAGAGNPNTTAWAWGFATMMGIYISGGISGAHLNPTITVMLWFYRGFPKRMMLSYFMAQFLGAFIAALCVYGVYYSSIHHYLSTNGPIDIVNSFVTSQREDWIRPETAFFNEFLGMICLSVSILALGDDQNAPPGAGMNSLIIGLVITALNMSFAYQTGIALNPSRDFGPRLALLALGYGGELFRNPYWFYGPWAGSLSAAFIGAFLYDFMIFTGGESPVNYPWERTQRSMRKSRAKWKRRLHMHLGKRDKEYIQ